jgi:hypothetical protein
MPARTPARFCAAILPCRFDIARSRRRSCDRRQTSRAPLHAPPFRFSPQGRDRTPAEEYSKPVLRRPPVYNGVASFFLSVGWILAITHAFNLIDGLDGLAAGSTVFSTVVLFLVALRYDKEVMGLVAVIFAGAALGFLHFNFNPASIFLGDSGSLFIGFVLSVAAVATSVKAPMMIAVTIPIACFGLPILDTAFTVFRRTKNRKHLFIADQEHIHHRLLKRGLTHREAVIALYCACALFALIGLFMMKGGAGTAGVLLVLAVAVWLVVAGLGDAGIAKLAKVVNRNEASVSAELFSDARTDSLTARLPHPPPIRSSRTRRPSHRACSAIAARSASSR